MKTLQLSDADARTLHKANIPGVKEILEANWSKEFFTASVMERIKTEDDIFAELGIDKSDWTAKRLSIVLRKDQIAREKIEMLAQVLNEGWQPNWYNEDEWKYYPWFYMTPGGFRFVDSTCDDGRSDVGSRLCYKSRELSDYAGKQFIHLYKEAFVYE